MRRQSECEIETSHAPGPYGLRCRKFPNPTSYTARQVAQGLPRIALSRAGSGRVALRVRSGQIRAECTRNARQEANLNKQHKQRTTPASFYDAAIRHSRFQISHIIIGSITTGSSPCLGFSHGPRPTASSVRSASVCAPFMRQPQSQPQPADTASVFRTFHLLRSQHVSYDGNLRVSADRSIVQASERVSKRFLFPWIRSAYLVVTEYTHTQPPSPAQLSLDRPSPAQPRAARTETAAHQKLSATQFADSDGKSIGLWGTDHFDRSEVARS